MKQPKPHRVQLKGKYLLPVERYAQSLDFDRESSHFNEHLAPVRQMIASLHADYLDEDHAHMLVLDVYLKLVHDEKFFNLRDGDRAATQATFLEMLISKIESYPRAYTCRIKLPSFPAYVTQTNEFADDVRLVMVSRSRIAAEIVQTMEVQEEPDDQIGTWIEVDSKGYGTSSLESPAVSAAMSTVKQCLFVLESFQVLKSTYYPPLASTAFLVDQSCGDIQPLVLSTPFAEHCGLLIPNEDKLEVWEGGKASLLGNLRPAANEEEKARAIKGATRCLERYLQARQHPDFERLAAAIEWYQDSKISDNQTFSYLAACIGLEAILGEESVMHEMSNRLADRYAFRMGSTRSKRIELATEYGEVLTLRGRLVHAKSARLKSPKDRQLLYRVQQMLYSLIWHELEILYKDEKDAQKQAELAQQQAAI